MNRLTITDMTRPGMRLNRPIGVRDGLTSALGGATAPPDDVIAIGLALILDARYGRFEDAARTIPSASGGLLGGLTDWSGNGRHATATSASRPLVFDDGSGADRSYVYLDGGDDFMTVAGFDLCELYVRHFYDKASTFPSFDGLFNANNGAYLRGAATQTAWRSNGGVDGRFGSDVFVGGVQTLAIGTLSDWASTDGRLGAAFTSAGFEIGRDYADATRCWGGGFSRLVVSGRVLTAGERIRVRSYITTGV